MALPRFRATERQFLLLLLSASLLTVGAAFLWRELFRPRADRLAPGGVARVFWLRPSETPDIRLTLAEYFDPSLMALPGPHGFSAVAWARRAAPAPPQFSPARPETYWPPPQELPLPELLPAPALAARVEAGIERLALPVGDADEEAPLPAVTPLTESVVQVLGALATRRLVVVPALPRVAAEAPARRSRVWIGVGADGRVRHAVLERASGNETLDRQAVELARQLEFERVIGADPLAVTWGVARFVWANGGNGGAGTGQNRP